MTLNRFSLAFFIVTVVIFFNFKIWGSNSFENIESNPCKYSTLLVLQNLDHENVDINFGNVSFLPEFKNVICIGSVINIKENESKILLVSGFNSRLYIIISQLIPIIFFLFWRKYLLSNKQLIINLLCWISFNQLFFLFYNDLNILNYFLFPYLVLIYGFFNLNSNES